MEKFLRDKNVDSDRFRAGMAQLTGAVNIIATRNGQILSGLTASAVCSLSSEPPRLIACVNINGNSFQHIAEKAKDDLVKFLIRSFIGIFDI